MSTKPTNIPFSRWPLYDEEQIAAAADVLRSGRVNYWTGPHGREFEDALAERMQAKYAIAVANGTVAIELALLALGIGPGDDVVVPCRTFIATASAIVARGARPVMADVELDSQNISADSVHAVLTPHTKAVIAVHLAGRPCEMGPLLDLARAHNLHVVEDCAQAIGATYRGYPVGSLGDVGCYSFCTDKIISTGGEGGALVTNSDKIWNRAWSYKDHGKCPELIAAPADTPGFRWLHTTFGTNWRLTGMQAALGLAQLSKLDVALAARKSNAIRIDRCCRTCPGLRTLTAPTEGQQAYYRYYAFVRTDRLADGWTRDRILQAIEALGVPCFSGSCGEIYLERAFESIRPVDRLPMAKQLAETSLAWLVDPTLTEAQIERTCDAIQAVMKQATRLGVEDSIAA
ncbi:DegT/DnrJ/EryC1/StrS family aminotransferase [Botrimarina mediterranea]|uniref:DegT/DnrJ/EryC1/StrS family aminotransferase n=1 Tax=Botrimarina mediterranea TaxID=2528022 RepID=UPI00118884B1|nr:UDP-4-amino-4-deoxy-L-arabinose--oxoglutarate aminotransferase [Planctomycetes bacterium K2D]